MKMKCRGLVLEERVQGMDPGAEAHSPCTVAPVTQDTATTLSRGPRKMLCEVVRAESCPAALSEAAPHG